jgi:uncharacterized protein (TIGR00251 family)
MNDGRLKVRVTASPVDGAANRAVVKLLARHLGVKRRQIEITHGFTGRDKVIRITGAPPSVRPQHT